MFPADCTYIEAGTRRDMWTLSMRLAVSLAAVTLSLGVAAPALAADPIGYLDGAGCDAIVGWAQDPDSPDTPIDVHFYYGGPAGSGAPASAINANVYREDLCTAIGSCAHGFSGPTPMSLLDGQARNIHAYGIDTGGGNNPQLGNAPRVLQCAPPVQSGERRRVDGLTSLDAWKFSSFWDMLPLGSGADTLPEGPPLQTKPELVRGDDASEQVWLLDADGHVRRLVSPAAMAAWRFDAASIQTFPAADVLSLVQGTDVRARPVTFIAGSLFVVDDPQPTSGDGPSLTSSSSAGAGGSSIVGGSAPLGGGGGGEGGAGEGGGAALDGEGPGEFGSCACSSAAAAGNEGWAALALLALVVARRRS
jgi:MYXO-CTERM domain-containing protein